MQVCSAYLIRGFLDEKILPLSPEELATTTVTLLSDSENGELPFQETSLRGIDGHFVFSNVSAGDYLVVLNSILLDIPGEAVKVTVAREQVIVNKVFNGHDFKNDLGPSSEYPIVITPVLRQNYILQRESLGLFKMFKSPMMLMMLASVAMVFVLPKMMEGMGK